MAVTGQGLETFGGLLRRLRMAAELTQEELADASGLGARTISDLERGVASTARKDTARLLADALGLDGPERTAFEAAARGRAGAGQVAAGGGSVAATRTLPRDIVSFTGRDGELGRLLGAAAGGVVGIHAIGGMAGVGKTAFAVHAAHRLAPQFPGGQVFLPLHGHTPGQQPVDPAGALASLLLTLGVAPQQIPADLEGRMALWRDRLAGRQLLLVLDDAASSEQVRPLLPGDPGCLVLVTSRRRLTALDDARAISLDTLTPDEAADLLVRLAVRPGLDPADPAVAQLTRLCGYLPLAVGMLARQLHHHPAWAPGDLVTDLTAARDRLDLLFTENLSVAAAFDLSYQDLTEDQQQMFRRLSLHPGPDIDAYATAALGAISFGKARKYLDVLYELYLLTELVRGRYRLHDLVRAHARAMADDDPADQRAAAADRVLGYYQQAVTLAAASLAREPDPEPGAAAAGLDVPNLSDDARALAWMRTERANLLACLGQVSRSGDRPRVIALTAGLAPLLRRDGPWSDAIALHVTAARVAREATDRRGEAAARCQLGVVQRLSGDYADAASALNEALAIYREIGERRGQARALSELGTVWRLTGDYAAAVDAQTGAIAIFRDFGERQAQASALNQLAIVRRLTGDYAGTASTLDEALAIYRELADPLGQGSALNSLAAMNYHIGNFAAASQTLDEALRIFRELDDPLGQVNALNALGAVRIQTGDVDGATAVLDEALQITTAVDSRLGRAYTLCTTGILHRTTGRYQEATAELNEALSISRGLGDRLCPANALCELGIMRQVTEDYAGAIEALEEALAAYRGLGDQGGEAATLNELGTVRRRLDQLDQAEDQHRQALALGREIASPMEEAHALAGLGRCALAAGQQGEARDYLRRAWELLTPTGAAETGTLAAELEALGED